MNAMTPFLNERWGFVFCIDIDRFDITAHVIIHMLASYLVEQEIRNLNILCFNMSKFPNNERMADLSIAFLSDLKWLLGESGCNQKT